MRPFLRQWVEAHRNIDHHVLVAYFTNSIVNSGMQLVQSKVITPNWTDLMKFNRKINWLEFLELPENLFRQDFVDDKLSKLPVRKQQTIVRALNKIARNYRGILKERPVPTVIDRVHTPKKYVKLFDVMKVINSIFFMRKRRTTHFAIDLYIVLLGSQRFLADADEIEKGLK